MTLLSRVHFIFPRISATSEIPTSPGVNGNGQMSNLVANTVYFEYRYLVSSIRMHKVVTSDRLYS